MTVVLYASFVISGLSILVSLYNYFGPTGRQLRYYANHGHLPKKGTIQ